MMSQEVMAPDGNGHSDEGWTMESRNAVLAAWAFEHRLSSALHLSMAVDDCFSMDKTTCDKLNPP